MQELIIIGAGLAGCEAAWQAARHGIKVILCEMRPDRMTEAHKTPSLAELVCSNSLRSMETATGPGLLKKELEMAGSLIMTAARATEVSSGSAMAVDRILFSEYITEALDKNPLIDIVRKEITELPDSISIIATGPLTSNAMAESIKALIGGEHLHFYDAIAPIVDSESIDYSIVYFASRYGKGGNDYINCPMNKDEYDLFYDSLINADIVTAREFEDIKVFEGCMPVEIMAKRGRDTLRFGPLKPVGLRNPLTGSIPYAVVQLRPENREKTSYNMVGFQTRLKWNAQKSVFRLIPGLENAEFLRLGSIHRNTYINSPIHLNEDLSLKMKDNIYLAGQMTGVEGYIESTAIGLIAGVNASKKILGKEAVKWPSRTAHGSLLNHIIYSRPEYFVPSNINFGLIPADEDVMKIRDKRLRRQAISDYALKQWNNHIEQIFDF